MVTRDEIIAACQSIAPESVAYSMVRNGFPGGFRSDCSGFASKVLGLPAPGLSTVTLRPLCTPIDFMQLMPGDLIGALGPGTEGSNGHVQIFHRWMSTPGSRYWVYEQTPNFGPQHNLYTGLPKGYAAYRYNALEEDMSTENPTEAEMWAHNAASILAALASGADTAECRYAWTSADHALGDKFAMSLAPYWERVSKVAADAHIHQFIGVTNPPE